MSTEQRKQEELSFLFRVADTTLIGYPSRKGHEWKKGNRRTT
ncbi:MAG: hypothetical protein ACRD2L_15840 [Terriglobia bacterium]